ncbi:MAG: ferredoxin [Candidatus Krumholzibacteriota bacterium]|nr:ferredoxin [Candidatus Krumholzibacteriota bacterium]
MRKRTAIVFLVSIAIVLVVSVVAQEETKTYRLENRDACTGCGRCVDEAPGLICIEEGMPLFEKTWSVYYSTSNTEEIEKLDNAANECPFDIIQSD